MHDEVWRALADPTRRHLLDLLKAEPRSTGALCEACPKLDRCTVMKHLEILVQSHLVTVERRGRSRINHLNPLPLHQIVEKWISGHTAQLALTAQKIKILSEETST
ncbi:MAG: helix-turn-helix transcriptional regulator [Fimbriimonadaceae bacterium]|nr:helix-turn-helix transcriptional regulator [Fimbriimonadaceae bacterium]